MLPTYNDTRCAEGRNRNILRKHYTKARLKPLFSTPAMGFYLQTLLDAVYIVCYTLFQELERARLPWELHGSDF